MVKMAGNFEQEGRGMQQDFSLCSIVLFYYLVRLLDASYKPKLSSLYLNRCQQSPTLQHLPYIFTCSKYHSLNFLLTPSPHSPFAFSREQVHYLPPPWKPMSPLEVLSYSNVVGFVEEEAVASEDDVDASLDAVPGAAWGEEDSHRESLGGDGVGDDHSNVEDWG